MPRSMRRFAAAMAAVLAAPCAHAQSPAPQPEAALTMEEAVQTAVSGNPALRSALRETEVARSALRSARSLSNPEVIFTPAVTDFGSDEELLVRQPLEINGTRAARAGVARARLEGTQAQAVVALRDLVFETQSAYIELARAREMEELAREMLAAAEESDRLTRRQVEVGTRPGIDQVQTGIEAVRARQEVTRAEGQTAAAAAVLNTVMGRPANTPIGPLTPLSALPAPPEPVAAAVEQALSQRAEITVAEAARREFQQEARLARAEGRPDLAPQFRAGTVTRGVHETGIGLGITLPLLDWGSRRNRVRQAEKGAEAQALRIEAVRNQVRQDVAQAIARHQAAEAVVAGYQAGVLDQARRLLDASRTGVQAGQTSVLALLEAQRTYRAVQIEFTNALADRAVAAAALEQSVGAVPAALLNPAQASNGKTQ